MTPTAVTPTEFRRAMGRFATGVMVVTTIVQGEPSGLTVSAFCSVSLDPQLVLVSLQQKSQTNANIGKSGCFGVNLLRLEQQSLAERFASNDRRGKIFVDIPHHVGPTGMPLFDEALARIECRVVQRPTLVAITCCSWAR
jgi:flavin reductase (DIM6/NTAB) family NADH-FMN oxidoreductase RutF